MTPDEQEHLNTLCKQIQVERDYNRYEALLLELYELLSQKERRFPSHSAKTARARKTVRAIAKQIIRPKFPKQQEKVEISISDADDLFREIRIENSFSDGRGQTLALVSGAALDVTFEANAEDTIRKDAV